MKYVFILILSVICAQGVTAKDKDSTVFWKVNLTSTGSYLNGNASRFLSSSRLQLNRFSKKMNLITDHSYTYGISFNHKTENDLRTENFIDFFPEKKLVPFVRFYVETNYLRQIDSRIQPGLGCGYYFFRSNKHSLKLFAALAYENTFYRTHFFNTAVDSTHSNIESLGSIFGLVGMHEPNQKISINYRFYYQQSVQLSDLNRFFAETSLSIALNKKYSFTSMVRYSFENIVPSTFKQYDFIWTFGVTFRNAS